MDDERWEQIKGYLQKGIAVLTLAYTAMEAYEAFLEGKSTDTND